jgi:DNA-directed RNA polymerase specialized sigma24 family protein
VNLQINNPGQTLLHLVDKGGRALPKDIRQAVEAAHRWVKREYPRLDEAVIAGWAEDVAKTMGVRRDKIESPKRYAFAALNGKARAWFRTQASREVPVGIGNELEQWIGVDRFSQGAIYRETLFDQLKSRLNERDRQILILLQQDITSPASVAGALGVSYAAAAKAIQRTKERIFAILMQSPQSAQNQTQADQDDPESEG